MDNVTVYELLIHVIEEICDNYCKYPQLYGCEDEDIEKLSAEHCEQIFCVEY